MKSWSCSHLSDDVLLREFTALAWRERQCTAELVAHIAEVERRRLYAREGCPSMFRFCVDQLHFSEHAAYRRIQVARTARRHPAILPALADGRLTLSTVLFLRPYLTRANAAGLLEAAFHRKKEALKELLAERFPRPDLPARVIAAAAAPAPLAALATPAASPSPTAANVSDASGKLAPALVAPAQASAIPLPPSEMAPRATTTPLSPGHYGIQFTFEQDAYDAMRYALALASHEIGPKDLAKLFALALESFVRERERRKFAACVRAPRVRKRDARPAPNPRYVPAPVRREVWQRDGGRCTFTSESGRRCESCERLEFDHVEPVANGGQSTAANLRLRCRAHNQLAAERAFGAAFVDGQRERSGRRAVETRLARARAEKRARAAALPQASQEARDPSPARAAAAAVARTVEMARAAERARAEVIPWLRALGVRLEEARRAVDSSNAPPDASLEERVKAALRTLGPRSARTVRPAANAAA